MFIVSLMAGCLKLQKEQPQVLQDRVNGWKLSKLMQKQSAKAQYNIRYMYKATAGWNGSKTERQQEPVEKQKDWKPSA